MVDFLAHLDCFSGSMQDRGGGGWLSDNDSNVRS